MKSNSRHAGLLTLALAAAALLGAMLAPSGLATDVEASPAPEPSSGASALGGSDLQSTVSGSKPAAPKPGCFATSQISATLNCLVDSKPTMQTMQGDYRIETESTTKSGETFRHTQTGRFFLERQGSDVRFSLQRLAGQAVEMQSIYASDEGYVRYFPYSHYGQRLDNVLEKGAQTDFAKFWRRLLVWFEPMELEAAPGLTLQTPTSALLTNSPAAVYSRPDRDAEWATRVQGLEFWGADPSQSFHYDGNARLRRVDATFYRPPRLRKGVWTTPTRKRVDSLSFVTEQTVNGQIVPRRLEYTARKPSQTTPYRTSTLTLERVRVNQALPSDAFAPIWPSDTIFTWVVHPGVAVLQNRPDDPASTVGLIDHAIASGDPVAARSQLAAYGETLGEVPSPAALAEYARLAARVGWREKGIARFDATIARLEKAREAMVDGLAQGLTEEQLARYYYERAVLIERMRGRRDLDGPAAATFLQAKAVELTDPPSRARVLCGAVQLLERNDRGAEADALLQASLNDGSSLSNPDYDRWMAGCAHRFASESSRHRFFAASALPSTGPGSGNAQASSTPAADRAGGRDFSKGGR